MDYHDLVILNLEDRTNWALMALSPKEGPIASLGVALCPVTADAKIEYLRLKALNGGSPNGKL